jgi:predicted nucleic acid-binding protein
VCGLNRDELFQDFLLDTVERSVLLRVCLSPDDLRLLLKVKQQFGLDFHDSYQYVAAGKIDATVVSFDRDFDRTERGRKTPAEALAEAGETEGE